MCELYFLCLTLLLFLGQTCVHVAALNGHIDVLRHLVCCGADINAREGRGGYTALHYAVQRRDDDMIFFLLTECSKIDPRVETYGRKSVLEIGYKVSSGLEDTLRAKGVESPYPSEDEYDSDEVDESDYEVGKHFSTILEVYACHATCPPDHVPVKYPRPDPAI